jgi:hypothetical protein
MFARTQGIDAWGPTGMEAHQEAAIRTGKDGSWAKAA